MLVVWWMRRTSVSVCGVCLWDGLAACLHLEKRCLAKESGWAAFGLLPFTHTHVYAVLFIVIVPSKPRKENKVGNSYLVFNIY